MKLKTSTIFYIFVILLVGGVYYFDYHQGEQKQKAKDEASVLLPFAKDIVKKVELTQSSGEVIELIKDEKGWQITKPISDKVDPNTMSDWLNSITTEKSSETIGNSESDTESGSVNWTTYGLDKPKAKIKIFNYQDQSTSMDLGTRKNIDGNPFVRKNQDAVVMVGSTSWSSHLDKTVRDFRDKRINRDGFSSMTNFKIKKDKFVLNLKTKEGLWYSPENEKIKLAQNNVREVVNAINDMRASEFTLEVDPSVSDKNKFGLSKPSMSVEVETEGKPLWTVDFGQDKDKNWYVWVKDLHRVYKVDTTQVDKLFKAKLEDLKEKEPTPTPSPSPSPSAIPTLLPK